MAHFLPAEISILLDGVKERSDILLEKSNAVNVVTKKRQAWEEIAIEMNKANPDVKRKWSTIRKKWANIKLEAKQKGADVRRSMKKTGNADEVKPPSETQSAILDILGGTPAFAGLQNFVDSEIDPDETEDDEDVKDEVDPTEQRDTKSVDTVTSVGTPMLSTRPSTSGKGPRRQLNRKRQLVDVEEDEELKNLQRKVLLKQLDYYKRADGVLGKFESLMAKTESLVGKLNDNVQLCINYQPAIFVQQDIPIE